MYPLAEAPKDKDRSRGGMVEDVADVLVANGYPRPVSNADWIELQQALFRLLLAVPRERLMVILPLEGASPAE